MSVSLVDGHIDSVSTWDDLSIQIARLIKENERLKAEKQQLVNENVNLKIELRKYQKSHLEYGLISEGRPE